MEHFGKGVYASVERKNRMVAGEIRVAEALLIDRFPDTRQKFWHFTEDGQKMLGGDISGTVTILEDLKAGANTGCMRHQLVCRNLAESRGTIWFSEMVLNGILVSGQEDRKPDPRIYAAICRSTKLHPAFTLFIDDNQRNIQAAQDFGLQTIHFTTAETLAEGSQTVVIRPRAGKRLPLRRLVNEHSTKHGRFTALQPKETDRRRSSSGKTLVENR